jgi:histidinol-phosphate phosphatase family protein
MNKAIFLDRDGVINEHIYETDGKIMAPANLEQLKILDKVKEGISMLKDLKFKIIVVTNQPGIAFGYLNEEKLKEINIHLKSAFGIDEVYYCPHHPKYNSPCTCRKPNIGLLDQAKKDYDLDIQNSYMVGDSLSDIQTGYNAEVKKTFRIGIPREDIIELQNQKKIFPDFTLPNLVEVAEKIKSLES